MAAGPPETHEMTSVMPLQAIAVFDIDGVIRDVGGSYRRALADTVESFTQGRYRPTAAAIDDLKAEGRWNNDWEASQELIYRYFETQGQPRADLTLSYEALVDFFQQRYRGPHLDDPAQWTGYISQEPLLVSAPYFEQLTQAHVTWGFFSGATRGSAAFVLERRLGLSAPLLVAMHDAAGKPDPTGCLQVAEQLSGGKADIPVRYVGDTVADMHTVQQARQQRPTATWIGVGILPPHVVAADETYTINYAAGLKAAGASLVLPGLTALTPDRIKQLINDFQGP